MPGITASRGPALTIGALSRHTGVKIEAIRFYERAGVLPKPPRSAGGHRVYNADQLKRLSFVRRSRELGFSLDDVRGLLRLVDGGHYTCAEVKGITLDHLGDIRRKIADLRRLERTLCEVAGKCRGEKVPECPVIDALFSPVPSASAAAIGTRRGIRHDPERQGRQDDGLQAAEAVRDGRGGDGTAIQSPRR